MGWLDYALLALIGLVAVFAMKRVLSAKWTGSPLPMRHPQGATASCRHVRRSFHLHPLPSQIIQRARDLPAHGFRQFRIDFRGAHIRVAEQILDAAYVHAAQHQVSRIAMTEHMSRDPPGQIRQSGGARKFPCHSNLMQVVSPRDS